MKTQAIIEAVQNIFIGADERDWALCRRSFTDKVLIDYESMTGNPPALVAADDIIAQWKDFLPRFTATHHQLGNFSITHNQVDKAGIFFYGTATHYLPNDSGNNIWTVVATYNAQLELHGDWQVNSLKMNLKYQDGNLDLPKLAMQNVPTVAV